MSQPVPHVPDELWLAVFQCLDVRDLKVMKHVNQQFRRVAADDSLGWREFFVERWGDPFHEYAPTKIRNTHGSWHDRYEQVEKKEADYRRHKKNKRAGKSLAARRAQKIGAVDHILKEYNRRNSREGVPQHLWPNWGAWHCFYLRGDGWRAYCSHKPCLQRSIKLLGPHSFVRSGSAFGGVPID